MKIELLEQLLLSLGVNVSSSVIYDFIKNYFTKNEDPTIEEFQSDLSTKLNIENADIKADKIIQFLAQKGDIIISGTNICASKSITMQSSLRTKFDFGDNSKSETEKTSIKAGLGARIVGKGGAKIEQREDGSIEFYT